MASPQLEDGYIKISNDIWDALTAYRLPGEQVQCLMFILRKTYGWNKKQDAISLSQFVDATNMKKPNIIRAINGLLSKKIISVIKKDNAPANIYEFIKNFDKWAPLSKKITLSKKIISVIKKDNASLSKKIPTKDTTTKDTITKDKIHIQPDPSESENKNGIPYREIIEYLNQKTGRDFKPSIPKTQKLIGSLWKQGFRFNDFKRVIDIKSKEWISNSEFSKFLRPETLFGTKFEGYLNQMDTPNPLVSEKTSRTIANLKQWMMEDQENGKQKTVC